MVVVVVVMVEKKEKKPWNRFSMVYSGRTPQRSESYYTEGVNCLTVVRVDDDDDDADFFGTGSRSVIQSAGWNAWGDGGGQKEKFKVSKRFYF
jgi:hypothetical protein